MKNTIAGFSLIDGTRLCAQHQPQRMESFVPSDDSDTSLSGEAAPAGLRHSRAPLALSVAVLLLAGCGFGTAASITDTATNYFEITPKGLTRELGFVGYYGEVLDWVTMMYDAPRPAPGQPGDEKILAQLEKIIHARAPFRAPGTEDGFRVMRAETIVGWRDGGHYPGNVVYAERATWDASPLRAVAVTRDAEMAVMPQGLLGLLLSAAWA